ncbi:cobalamin biosynthesis protein CbiA [Streptomyces sp. NPDC056367]|uniref:cobalamin biosynthesis protein CbiA n=1 Tax=Streptomyces sp. NPDC056367 TaxID=3345797 RepID=UPI0035DCC5B4
MPSGDNWQGDVLRDLRAGQAAGQADQNPPHPDQEAQHPGQQASHPVHPGQGAPQAQQPSVPHPGQGVPQHAQPQPGPGAPQPGHPAAAGPQGFPGHAGQAPAYGYPGPEQAQAAGHAAGPQASPGAPAARQGQAPAYGYEAQAQAHAPGPQKFPGHDPAQQGQAPAYGYPGPEQAGQAPGAQGFPGQVPARQGQAPAYGYPDQAQAAAGRAAGPQGSASAPAARQGQAPAYGYEAQAQAQAQAHAPGPQGFPGHDPARQGQAPAYGYPGPDQAQGQGHPAAQQGQGHTAGYGYPGQTPSHSHPQQQAKPQPRRASAGARTPDSRPPVDPALAAAGRKPLHGEAFGARATRAVRRIVSSSAAREVADATRSAELLQQSVTTGRQIAVTSIRGGAGKSTVAALLGTTYAHYRQDPVLFVEADPALGSLPIRLGAESLRWTTGDIADIVEPQMSLLDITGYLVQLHDNAWLLPGSQGQIGAMLDTRSYERAMVALRRYFGVTVVDCETLPAEVARVALTASQARVLTTPATLDGVMSTYAVLQWMQGLPQHVIAGTVVVLTEQAPHSGIDLAEAVRSLESTGTGVHVLPYDRHLAAGGRIRTELLAHSTRQTTARLAADVFQLSQQRH